jgi:hypothetical protein
MSEQLPNARKLEEPDFVGVTPGVDRLPNPQKTLQLRFPHAVGAAIWRA